VIEDEKIAPCLITTKETSPSWALSQVTGVFNRLAITGVFSGLAKTVREWFGFPRDDYTVNPHYSGTGMTAFIINSGLDSKHPVGIMFSGSLMSLMICRSLPIQMDPVE
jgi:hypothetical protein